MSAATAPAIKPATATPAPSSAGPLLRRFTVDEYHRLLRDGYFAHDEGYELIDGFIVKKMPKDPIHEAIVLRSNRVLTGLLPPGWHVRVQAPVSLSTSEPEPDLSVAPGDELSWVGRHPGPADVAFVIEVSNTSLADDRAVKGPLYARDGIPAYAILNLNQWRVELQTDPSGDDPAPAYRRREDLGSGAYVVFPLPGVPGGIRVAVDDLLPPQIRPKRA